jgi:hypothetical protein
MNSADQSQIGISLRSLITRTSAGGQVAAEVGSLTFLATWGLNRPEPGHSYGGIGETLRGNRRIGAGSGAGWNRQFS